MALYFPPLFVKLTVKGCSSPVLHYFKSLAKITKKNNGFAQKKKKLCVVYIQRGVMDSTSDEPNET